VVGNGYVGTHIKEQISSLSVKAHLIDSNSFSWRNLEKDKLVSFLKDTVGLDNRLVIINALGCGSVQAAEKIGLHELDTERHLSVTLLQCFEDLGNHGAYFFISSYSVYGECVVPANEEAAICPNSSYAKNKIITETALASNCPPNVSLHILRTGSLYDGIQGRGVLREIRKIPNGVLPVQLRGTGEEIRDFIHISDFLNCVIQLSSLWLPGVNVWNVGTGISLAIRDVAKIAAETFKVDFSKAFVFDKTRFEFEPIKLEMSIIKLKREISFSPRSPIAGLASLFSLQEL
jgi:nucleoside-diphosphate-sugar epimerase